MKLVMLGGTFNPPHKGHLAMADQVRKVCGYDKVVMIPSFQPAHKSISMGVTPEQRLRMTELASAEIEEAFVSDCEIRRKGISYSLDTIRYLKNNYGIEGNPGLIIGDDLVAGFSHWHEADILAMEADIIILHREESGVLDFPYSHTYISNKMIRISSSEVREKVHSGLSVTEDLPSSVIDYIQKEGLYL